MTLRDHYEALRSQLTDREREMILDARLAVHDYRTSSGDSPLIIAKHAAERRVRAEFQARWGAFWKCPGCGGRVEQDDVDEYERLGRRPMHHHDPEGGRMGYTQHAVRVSYTPPPTSERP